MKKVLILGASLLQLPAIRKAKELGYYVAVVDYDSKAPGIRYADEYFNVSTTDVQKVVEVAELIRADGVLTLATDMPVRSVAAACEALGLPGISFETAIRATDKGEMMKAFHENGVAHPWFLICESFEDLCAFDIEYPCIVKPTDSSGSCGVLLVNDPAEMRDAWEYSSRHSRSGRVIIEEYLQGQEVSVEILVIDGTPHVVAVTDKITTGPPHFVELGHSQPSRLREIDLQQVRRLAVEAVRALGINIGAAHVEIMLTQDGPRMIELGARLGGDFIATHLVPLSTGVDLVEAVIRQACGDHFGLDFRSSRNSIARFLWAKSGTIKEIEGIAEARSIPGVNEIILLKGVGDTISELASSNDRIGVVIAEGRDEVSAENAYKQALERIRIQIC